MRSEIIFDRREISNICLSVFPNCFNNFVHKKSRNAAFRATENARIESIIFFTPLVKKINHFDEIRIALAQ